MKKTNCFLLGAGIGLAVLIVPILLLLPVQVEKSRNRIYAQASFRPTQSALDLHKKLLIVDMHADSLLWDRNLLKRSTYGHVDIRRMETKHMLIDLAHASPQTIVDTLAIVKQPVRVSHTGLNGICPSPRNLTDKQVQAIAATGSIICIGYWDEAVCGPNAKAIARAIKYAVQVAGIEHVGLGSDYDGDTTVPFDTGGLVELTAALLAEGFSASEIEAIMGGNMLRLLERTLP